MNVRSTQKVHILQPTKIIYAKCDRKKGKNRFIVVASYAMLIENDSHSQGGRWHGFTKYLCDVMSS